MVTAKPGCPSSSSSSSRNVGLFDLACVLGQAPRSSADWRIVRPARRTGRTGGPTSASGRGAPYARTTPILGMPGTPFPTTTHGPARTGAGGYGSPCSVSRAHGTCGWSAGGRLCVYVPVWVGAWARGCVGAWVWGPSMPRPPAPPTCASARTHAPWRPLQVERGRACGSVQPLSECGAELRPVERQRPHPEGALVWLVRPRGQPRRGREGVGDPW